MKTLIPVACALVLVIKSLAADAVTIDGQVFIRTKGGESIKLSLVDVLLYDEKTIVLHLENKRKVAEPLFEEWRPLEKEAKDIYERAKTNEEQVRKRYFADILNPQLKVEWKKTQDVVLSAARSFDEVRAASAYTRSASYYFEGLPRAVQTAKTDADGKFSFQVPSGSYMVAAFSTRHAGKDIEFYYWMVKTTLATNQKVMLANDNLSTSGSADSGILTPENETVLLSALKGADIRAAASVIETSKRKKAAIEAQKLEEQRQAAAEIQREQEIQRQEKLTYYRQHPEAAQREAIKLFPELGIAGFPLNKEFVERAKRYRVEKKDFFAEPDWPVRLAKECKEAK